MSVVLRRQQLFEELDECDFMIKMATGFDSPSSLNIAYESVLLRAFRCYENYVEDYFLYMLVREPLENGKVINSYVNPTDLKHARAMLSVNSKYLEWSDPTDMIGRCNVFLQSDSPLALALAAKTAEFKWMKRIRNHVAHNSVESSQQYRGVLRSILLTEPSELPPPGEFLREIPSKGPCKNREVLAFFISAIREFASSTAGAST